MVSHACDKFINLRQNVHFPTSEVSVETSAIMEGVWRTTLLLSLLGWMAYWYSANAQEYLPPKVGGKKHGAAGAEPTLPANYNFSYDVEDNNIALDFGHNEKRKDDSVVGSYHVLLPDGRMQLVEYEAGPQGYKPLVMYMGEATFPDGGGGGGKFDGYHYNAASNRQSVRQPAPSRAGRQPATVPSPAPPVLPSPMKNNSSASSIN